MTGFASRTSFYAPAAPTGSATPLIETLVGELDIAPSLYAKAADRHKSLGEWFCRSGSSLAQFGPHVHSQGSFRYGTVIKPIVEDARYDLDQVVVLRNLRPHQLSQADLKARLGKELAAYASAYGMQPPEEKHRCWRLNYRDEVPFHLDSVPSVPATPEVVASLRHEGVDEPWALRAVAITDDRHPQYTVVGGHWLTSNPRGFARWFEAQAARGLSGPLTKGMRASVEDVPTYEWRTPLQRVIQILKRHRDVMFRAEPELAPISMIITNLAARAYAGEQDLTDALIGVVERMDQYVRPTPPRVPNPTHPQEDYADKWRLKPILEPNFNGWLAQVRADVRNLAQARLSTDLIDKRFAIRLSEDQERTLGQCLPSLFPAPAIAKPSTQRIDNAPRPWGTAQ